MKINTNDLSLERPTWAEIDLDAIHSNFIKARDRVGPARILAVVKSDAYGHGASVVARELESAGAAFLGTATVSEAIELRKSGVKIPVLILSGMTPQQLPLLRDYDFIPGGYTVDFLQALSDYAVSHSRVLDVHLKIDTGMGRLGFAPEEAAEILKQKFPRVQIAGLFTHFATAEIPGDSYTQGQLRKFQEFLAQYRPDNCLVHAANSAAMLNYSESHFDLVRPGLILYGISPLADPLDFQAVLSLKSKIVFLHWIHKDETIGYGRTFKAQRDSLIATIPIGYADGLRRSLSNRLEVEVCGKMCRIAGTVSMDLCMIDVTAVAKQVRLYDVVTLIGPRTPAIEWARLLDTVPYEITCLIGARIPRVYYKNGEVVDVYYP